MSDYIVRSISENKEVRGFAVTSRDTVEEARRLHDLSPVVSAALGRLLSAGLIMGSMQKGDDKLTLEIRSEGPVKGLTVTADAGGTVKGFALNPEALLPAKNGKLDVGGIVGKGYLKVIKDQGLKDPYLGEVELVNGEIAEDLTWYFASSEQVPSAVGLGVLMNKNNTVKQAGGFVIQMLPGASEESIGTVEKNLKGIKSVTEMLDSGKTPEDMINILMEGLSPEILESHPVSYRCGCSRDRVSRVLLSLGEKELRNLIAEGKDVELKCQFCDRAYNFTIPEMESLLAQSLKRN